MDIYKPGTKILINHDENILGTIIQVVITMAGNCLYKCSWWNGRARVEEFLYETEFTVGETKKEKIGFK